MKRERRKSRKKEFKSFIERLEEEEKEDLKDILRSTLACFLVGALMIILLLIMQYLGIGGFEIWQI